MKFAFISRHAPSQSQFEVAAACSIELIHVGDADGFIVDKQWVEDKARELQEGTFDGVVVVHAGAALRLAEDFIVGVFQNLERPPVDGKPQFVAGELHLFDLRFV